MFENVDENESMHRLTTKRISGSSKIMRWGFVNFWIRLTKHDAHDNSNRGDKIKYKTSNKHKYNSIEYQNDVGWINLKIIHKKIRSSVPMASIICCLYVIVCVAAEIIRFSKYYLFTSLLKNVYRYLVKAIPPQLPNITTNLCVDFCLVHFQWHVLNADDDFLRL